MAFAQYVEVNTYLYKGVNKMPNHKHFRIFALATVHFVLDNMLKFPIMVKIFASKYDLRHRSSRHQLVKL